MPCWREKDRKARVQNKFWGMKEVGKRDGEQEEELSRRAPINGFWFLSLQLISTSQLLLHLRCEWIIPDSFFQSTM